MSFSNIFYINIYLDKTNYNANHAYNISLKLQVYTLKQNDIRIYRAMFLLHYYFLALDV